MTGPRRRLVAGWEAWMGEAACKGKTALFFPPHNEQAEAKEKRELQAKRICANCPVRLECYRYAVEHDELGVWGCANERERKRARWAETRRRWRESKREAS